MAGKGPEFYFVVGTTASVCMYYYALRGVGSASTDLSILPKVAVLLLRSNDRN